MLINLYQKFVDMDGRIIKDINITENEEGVRTRRVTDLTLERVVSLALAEPVDQKMSGDTKIKCFDLLLQIISHKDGVVELEADDIAFIKNLIKPKFLVLVVGEAMRMLEGQDIGIEIAKDERIDTEPEPENLELEDKKEVPVEDNDKKEIEVEKS